MDEPIPCFHCYRGATVLQGDVAFHKEALEDGENHPSGVFCYRLE